MSSALTAWLVAATGLSLIVRLDLRSDHTGVVAGLAFLVAAALSMLRPRLASYWAILTGGTVATSEAARYVVAPHPGIEAPTSFVLAVALVIGIAAAGTGAGKSASRLVDRDDE